MQDESIAVIIPSQLSEMVQRVIPVVPSGSSHATYLAYVHGWIEASAKTEYREILKRDGLSNDPRVILLMCELAVARALVTWHEVRDRPPPMPTIKSLTDK